MAQRAQHGQQGFTLIELLVVMLMIGIILTFATLSLGDGGRGKVLEREAQRLSALVELAGEDAVLSGRELGVYFEPHGYRFLVLDGELWREVSNDQQLRPRQLPAGLALRVLVEDLPVNLQRPDKPEKLRPDVLILSSGDRTPFEALVGVTDPALPGELQRDQPRYRITAPPLGTPLVEGPLS